MYVDNVFMWKYAHICHPVHALELVHVKLENLSCLTFFICRFQFDVLTFSDMASDSARGRGAKRKLEQQNAPISKKSKGELHTPILPANG